MIGNNILCSTTLLIEDVSGYIEFCNFFRIIIDADMSVSVPCLVLVWMTSSSDDTSKISQSNDIS